MTTTQRTHKRSTYPLALRYKPGTDLARRSPGLARGRFRDAEEAERIRVLCPNAEQLEVVDVREVRT